MPDDYLSFDDALRELQMQEAELRALVSQGKLRAFRDENTLKFRRTDVESLRKQRETEPTLVLQPGGEEETATPEVPIGEEPVELLGDEALDYDDTAETIIGGDLGDVETGDTDFALEPEGAAVEGGEPSTKVPTIELTPTPGTTGDTDVPTLGLDEEETGGDIGSETEVPTMVLGLDDYDDTQVATEDVATEEVALEPEELAEIEPTTDLEPSEDVALQEEEREAEAAVGRITASSSLGTGEPLAVREQPSALYTAMCGIAAFFLLIPGGLFFYVLASQKLPKWQFMRSIVEFFWNQFKLTYRPPGW
jgi:hypothetical protein